MQCERDWFNVYGSRALDHFGRTTEPKVLTRDNAWRTIRDWGADTDTWYVYNYLTEERYSITEQQYHDGTSINADGSLNI